MGTNRLPHGRLPKDEPERVPLPTALLKLSRELWAPVPHVYVFLAWHGLKVTRAEMPNGRAVFGVSAEFWQLLNDAHYMEYGVDIGAGRVAVFPVHSGRSVEIPVIDQQISTMFGDLCLPHPDELRRIILEEPPS